MFIEFDKLPRNRVEFVDESGSERFSLEVDFEEKQLGLIQKLDFSNEVEKYGKRSRNGSSDEIEIAKENKKKKKNPDSTPWPWQSLMENMQAAQQELSLIIDVINTVEANEAVAVAGMAKPKPLTNEILSDLSVSTAKKLQSIRDLGNYFKQTSKSLENQIAKGTRFYNPLTRLQYNWRMKLHHRRGSEVYIFDLMGISSSKSNTFPFSTSIINVDCDKNGKLVLQLPLRSFHSLHFRFFENDSCRRWLHSTSSKIHSITPHDDNNKTIDVENVDECIKRLHSVLRDIHVSHFEEKVFDFVIHQALASSSGVEIVSLYENFLKLGVGKGASVNLSLMLSEEDKTMSSEELDIDKEQDTFKKTISLFPNAACFHIHLTSITHENEGCPDEIGLINDFIMSGVHSIFSKKVLSDLEALANGVPFVYLMTIPTWHTRMSSWSFFIKLPEFIVNRLNSQEMRDGLIVNVMVIDDCVKVTAGMGSLNKTVDTYYDPNLIDLTMSLLLKIASHVIQWLLEEALMLGLKASRDFLALSFDMEEDNDITLIAHVDVEDGHCKISWSIMVVEKKDKFSWVDQTQTDTDTITFLGYLSLESLYSILIDFTGFNIIDTLTSSAIPSPSIL
ncbi:hypothetical protein ZOSMA_38G00790 [Zostera marina]|uniref:Uncharacterized protein n=1 Tax=Zostera marina TaxID=29655 RepID=A0A0K9P700_ZOSMR|nr:hypothetical protein ZOSMA_38G00790 [Zostera marina]